jgi:tetratricopeptide (TPR) repeat protein
MRAVSGLVTAALAIVPLALVVDQLGASHRPAGETPPVAVSPARLVIDYPSEGSIFPPDILPPTFLWHDPGENVSHWQIEVTFGDGSRRMRVRSEGQRMSVGPIDQRCLNAGGIRPELTPEQASTHTWKPDEEIWAAIKKHSVKAPATVTITGYLDEKQKQEASRSQVTLQTSPDPVGAPIFYRDVPLIMVQGERGVIKPLPESATKLITWRLKDIGTPGSRALIAGFPTCANCHSFSTDGKTIGLDVDGPQNDKGLYAIVPLLKETSIRSENVIKWNSFKTENATKRFGFMSQISPNGQYVMTSIENPGTHVRGLDDRFYNAGYKDLAFGQVFYPTRGILAWYSKATGKLQPLPGADDPRYVQASAVWSPDGKYLLFLKAEAREPYPEGAKESQFANSPEETQIQYDIYRIPFNDGQGGVAEPVAGASRNGKSNSFPKVSPDGKWIVYVQAHNGLLMRPDSELYIVPASGGTARRLNSNAAPMNSWHSWSPNGHWLVFSSKRRGPYTRMYLTHIDAAGNDSPAIVIDDATAANRAVNIPEFVNIPTDGLMKIDSPATEAYRLFDVALDLAKKGQYTEAIAEWKTILQLDPEQSKAEYNLGVALSETGKPEEAVEYLRKSLELNGEDANAHSNLGVLLIKLGKVDEAIPHLEKALANNPNDAKARSNLGAVLAEKGRTDEAIVQLEQALQANPQDADAHNNLAVALARSGKLDEAIPHFEKALEADPNSVELHSNLGRVLAQKARFDEAIPHLEKALAANPNAADLQFQLGRALAAKGRLDEAIPHLEQALAANPKSAEAHRFLARVLSSRGRLDEAISHFEQALAIDPGLAEVHNDFGFALISKGRPDEAIAHFEKAVALAPGYANAHYNLGSALYDFRGRTAEAIVQWREALRIQPNHVLALNRTAHVLATNPDAAVRNGSEAAALAERAVQLSGGRDPVFLDTLAAAYAESGRFPEAVQTARQALDLATQRHDQRLAEAVSARIALYEAQTPFRENRQTLSSGS